MNVLIIGLDYYDYIPSICEAMMRAGQKPTFFPIENRSFWSKNLKRFLPGLYRARLDRYHLSLAKRIAGQNFEFVLFIQTHHVSFENMRAIRAALPRARFVLYNWDSLSTHDYTSYLDYFDKVFTFDEVDAQTIDAVYLPLFAHRDYFDIRPAQSPDYDLYFVGTIVTQARFDALSRLWTYCRTHGLTTHFHLKCSPPIWLGLKRAGHHLPGITLRSLSREQIISLMARSRGVFDFANHKQSGYTMRFVENMCAGQKIATENVRVLEEPFYRKDRFLIVDGTDFDGLATFLRTPVTSEIQVEKWSVDTWVARVLDPS